MKIKGLAKVLLLSTLTLLVGSPTEADGLCQKIFEARYSATAGSAHIALNEAFSPLIRNLSLLARNETQESIEQRVEEMRKTQPIIRGHYERNIYATLLGSHQRSKSQNFIIANYNAAVSHYSPLKLPAAVDTFIYTLIRPGYPERFGNSFNMFDLVITQRGNYPDAFYIKLLRTTKIMMELAANGLGDISKKTAENYSQLLLHETARGEAHQREGTPFESAPLGATLEGILSFHQFLMAMMTDVVPGAATPQEALRDIIFRGENRQGLVTDFTRRLPMGMLGPQSIFGHRVKDPIVRTNDGSLRLSQDMIDYMAKSQSEREKIGNKRRGVCPMASFIKTLREPNPSEVRKTGLQELAETYWIVFQKVNRLGDEAIEYPKPDSP